MGGRLLVRVRVIRTKLRYPVGVRCSAHGPPRSVERKNKLSSETRASKSLFRVSDTRACLLIEDPSSPNQMHYRSVSRGVFALRGNVQSPMWTTCNASRVLKDPEIGFFNRRSKITDSEALFLGHRNSRNELGTLLAAVKGNRSVIYKKIYRGPRWWKPKFVKDISNLPAGSGDRDEPIYMTDFDAPVYGALGVLEG